MKALILFSGGLDSILAAKLIMEQGIEVEAVNYLTIFTTAYSNGRLQAQKAADDLGIPLTVISVSHEYLKLIQNPRYGYGKNVNPCIDCRIFMLKKAGEYMKEVGASFLVTGEVSGERPMSQTRDTIKLIEKRSELPGLILRPLSAKLFEPTIPEKEGWVDREKLLDIQGRSRKPQMALAAQFGIADYPAPAGGCLLTDVSFAARWRDLIQHNKVTLNDVHLLKLGRIFRLSPKLKIIVGRNEKENMKIITLAQDGDTLFDTPDLPGPITLARGEVTDEDIITIASITVRHGKGKNEENVKVEYWKVPEEKKESIVVSPMKKQQDLETLRI